MSDGGYYVGLKIMKVTAKQAHIRNDEFEAEERGYRVRITCHRHSVLVDAFAPDGSKVQVEVTLQELAAHSIAAFSKAEERDFNL